jgi:hypothetical protein
MVQVRRSVVRAAIKQRDLAIVAQALAAKDLHAQKVPVELRVEALATLVN